MIIKNKQKHPSVCDVSPCLCFYAYTCEEYCRAGSVVHTGRSHEENILSPPSWRVPTAVVYLRCFFFPLHKFMHILISSLLQPAEEYDTHTHTHVRALPTLLLLTAVCSGTVKSQRCHLSCEPLIELFYVDELMQLFFSGQ